MRERIGKFEIIRLLGQGAMGKVYLGLDPALGREVAVKTIRLGSAFGSEATARFEREARAAGSLNHPNVVTIYEFAEDQGIYYMAMEFVQGEDLDALIRSRQWAVGDLLELLAQACDGLGYAHERGIVHRDIKPANILVNRAGKRPQAKLMDFGVALVGHSDLTQQGNWMGTVNYMAPEYLDSGRAGPASDIFAMGVVLYEILSGGRRPFSGETATSVLTAILRKPPAPFLPEELQGLNPALLEVVERALAKQPEERFASAEHLAEAIRQCLVPAEAPARPEHGPIGPAPAPQPEGQTLVVARNGKGQCMSLRVALRQAGPGCRIQVMPGVYRESLVLDKPVTLIGEGAPGEVVIESVKGPCLSLMAPGIHIANLQLQGLDEGDCATLLVSQGDAQVENCELTAHSGPALLVAPNAEPVLRDCSLRGAGGADVRIQQRGGVHLERCLVAGAGRIGLELEPGARATLVDCRISGQEAGGVVLEADARVELKGCRVEAGASVGVLVLEHGQALLEDCELSGHACSGVHVLAGASVQLRGCRIQANDGLGVSVLGAGLLTLEHCELTQNREAAVLVQFGGTVQMQGCQVFDGQSFGVVCGRQGRGVLEDCEIYGNVRTGAKVEPGASLLLVRCDLRDGRDTGILLLEDAQVTLEECVVHRNARGGILLAKQAADPILRGGNRIEDSLLRTDAEGARVTVAPVR